ncbi:MAG: type II toxin-antitoxin system VapC family toxin [Alphaproteobacteria bacterium]|nr:type II toxin-antitoxin system VapC family toxin [Alphaproteobacteria bacterium]
MIVVDASVAIKWLIDEPGSERAQDLLARDDELVAPDIIRLEVPSAIARRFRLGDLDADDVAAVLRLWDMSLARGLPSLQDFRRHLPQAVALSVGLRHPLADCLYLAVAEHLDLPMVSADRTLLRRVGDRFPLLRSLD